MNTLQAPILFEKQVIITLKGIRRSKKITQTDLANRIGVSRDTIARIESGKARIYLAQAVAIAEALDIMPHDLFLQDEQKEETVLFTNENMNLSNKNINVTFSIHPMISSPTYEVFPNDGEDPQRGDEDFIYHSEKTTRQLPGRGGDETPGDLQQNDRNPYLDEKAVDSYGGPMKKYILDHRLFWHWVPENKLTGLSISSVVEATLNQGKEEDIKWLFDTVGLVKVADIFKRGISGFRTNYSEDVILYFNTYFTRHAPGF
jgi:putative transcriptional regulator